MAHRHRVVVIGGGFAGLSVAKRLRHAKADVTLIDRRNFHLFQPLLYQVATGSLSPANIAAPLRAVLRGRKDVHIVLGDVRRIDVENRSVMLEEGDDVPYDTLVCAAGATHDYFGHDEWAEHARGLKTVEDATEIRRRVLMAFEKAARCADPAERASHLTFVVVGGGP
ncbi:MAG: FAD-dependent oxidoreductase, partial [Planctomycetota bacterium]